MNPAGWKKRIAAARRRREQMEPVWAEYARLHTNLYVVKPAANDDDLVMLPGGDQVKIGLVFRNLEQTFAVLHIPEIGVRAEAQEFTRAMDITDTHREQIVEYALVKSARKSGLMKKHRVLDAVVRDAVMIGHGVCYSWWREDTREVEVARLPKLQTGEEGLLVEVLDEATGEPAYEPLTLEQPYWQAVADQHVPVREFLFAADAKSIYAASWHGWEQVVPLEALRADPRFADAIPPDLQPSSWEVKDIYGAADEFSRTDDGVKLIILWDKREKRLLHFIESPRYDGESRKLDTDLLPIGDTAWPVEFSHPDDSPFSVFVPVPATDHPWGISQVEHVKVLATEGDKIRSRAANQTRQAKTLLAYNKQAVTNQDQLNEAMNLPDRSVVGVDVPEGGNLSELLHPITIPGAEAELFAQEARAEQGVRETSGISEVPWGGAGTATESENMMAVGAARMNRKRDLALQFVAEVLGKHLDYLRQWAPSGQAMVVTDWDGSQVPLMYGREAFQGDFDITVLPGGKAMTMTPVEQKAWIESFTVVANTFGPNVASVMLREYLTRIDFRSMNAIMRALNAQMGVGTMPGQVPPGGVDGKLLRPAFNPNDQTDGQAIRSMVNVMER